MSQIPGPQGLGYGWKSLAKRKWFGKGDRRWVVDERDAQTGRWVEMGRYWSKKEARRAIATMVGQGRDEGSLRVAKRPIEEPV